MGDQAAYLSQQNAVLSERITELRAQLLTAQDGEAQAEARLAAETRARARAEHALGVTQKQSLDAGSFVKLMDKIESYGAAALALRFIARDIVQGNTPLCDVHAIFSDTLTVLDHRYGSMLDIADDDPSIAVKLAAIRDEAVARRETIKRHEAIDKAHRDSHPSPWQGKQ